MYTDRLSHGGAELAGAVQQLYCEGQTDYSLDPIILTNTHGQPIGRIADGDAVIFCCRRGEREIQITEAFTDKDFRYFSRKRFNHLPFVILTLYHEKFKDLPVAFAPAKNHQTLGETLSTFGLRQLHISESEKFAHVTFFINGGHNQSFAGEVDTCIPSPKGQPAEQIPELSLRLVIEQLISGINEGFDFIVANFANGDVIGHTQNRESKIKCAQCVDECLGEVLDHALAANYLVMVTADHGNLEQLYTADGKPHVSHTGNPVPFLLVSPGGNPSFTLHPGRLEDIAPTILACFGVPQPDTMTGCSLIAPNMMVNAKKILLVILDGWGIGKEDDSNPIHLAITPTWDGLLEKYPHTCLQASGEAVGLQAGKVGNSEAGHMNIGSGRVVLQDDVRLDAAMEDGSFYENEVFLQTIAGVEERGSRLHLIGLLSEKSSHGSIEYPLALLRMAKEQKLHEVYLHLIFDGRSTQPGSAPDLLHKLEISMAEIGIGKIVTGMGRSLALDRDGNYQKTNIAYDALVFGSGRKQPAGWA